MAICKLEREYPFAKNSLWQAGYSCQLVVLHVLPTHAAPSVWVWLRFRFQMPASLRIDNARLHGKEPERCWFMCVVALDTRVMRTGWSDLKCCLAARYGRPAGPPTGASAADAAAGLRGICCYGDQHPRFRCEIAHTSSSAAGSAYMYVSRTNERDTVKCFRQPDSWPIRLRAMGWYLHRLLIEKLRKTKQWCAL